MRAQLGEALAVALGSAALAVATTWPLATHLRGHVPGDLGDPLLQAWQVAWGGHVLAGGREGLWDANTFHPLAESLAFSDALLGYSPAGLVGTGQGAAVTRYGLLVLVSYTVAAAGGYALARAVGAGRAAAVVAAAVVGAAPWRATQLGHLHVLSCGGIPLAVAFLLRGHAGTLGGGLGGGLGRPPRGATHRAGSAGWVVAGWLVATWQLTLGFGLGVPFATALGVGGALAVVAWLRAGRPGLARGVVAADVAGGALLGVVGLLLAQPYLRVVETFPLARRTVADLDLYSPPLRGLGVPPPGNRVWGDLLAPARDTLAWPPEQALALGGATLVLAVLGAVAAPWSRARRVGLVVACAVLVVLALGTTVGGDAAPYTWVFRTLPGWEGIRTPGRLVVLVTLLLAVLAAGGAQAVRGRLPGHSGALLVAACALAVAVEGAADTPVPRVPAPPVALGGLEAPVMVVSPGPVYDTRVMLWSTDGFPQVTNGLSGFVPPPTERLRRLARDLPDPAAARALVVEAGVRTVVVPTADERTARAFARAGLPGRLEGAALVVRLPPV